MNPNELTIEELIELNKKGYEFPANDGMFGVQNANVVSVGIS